MYTLKECITKLNNCNETLTLTSVRGNVYVCKLIDTKVYLSLKKYATVKTFYQTVKNIQLYNYLIKGVEYWCIVK